MGFFDLFKKKEVTEKPEMSLPDVEKVTMLCHSLPNLVL